MLRSREGRRGSLLRLRGGARRRYRGAAGAGFAGSAMSAGIFTAFLTVITSPVAMITTRIAIVMSTRRDTLRHLRGHSNPSIRFHVPCSTRPVRARAPR